MGNKIKSIPISRSFSLRKLTKNLYKGSTSWKLAIDQTIPKYFKNRIRESYELGLKFAYFFDRHTHKNGQVSEPMYKILTGWKDAMHVCCAILDAANDYKEEMLKRFGADIGEKIFQIKESLDNQQKSSSRTILFKLTEFDPGWLLEDWAARLIVDATYRSDHYFFRSLGGALCNVQKKFYKVSTYAKHAKAILEYLEKHSISNKVPHVPPNLESDSFLKNFPSLPKPQSPAELYSALLKNDSADGYVSEYTRKSFAEFLSRNDINFKPQIELIGYLKPIKEARMKYSKDVEYLTKLFDTLQESFPSVK